MDGTTLHVEFTDRADGDFRPLPLIDDEVAGDGTDDQGDRGRALAERRCAVTARSWTWLRQVHGARVVAVGHAGEMAGVAADGAITTMTAVPLAVTTADCAPVVLVAERGFAVVHAGWRGLLAGVVDNAASQLRAVAGRPVASIVGPCIGPSAYEFGGDDLTLAREALGDGVCGRTGWGTPALDVPAAVRLVCDRVGWPRPAGEPSCTSGDTWFSHRTRGDAARQATVAWMEADASGTVRP